MSNAEIRSCRVGSIANDVKNCQIRYCQSSEPLVWKTIEKSSISDCLVILDVKRTSDKVNAGGVASYLINTSVNNCFITGKWDGYVYFSGIANSVMSNSSVHHCALGNLKLIEYDSTYWNGIIAKKQEKSNFSKNIVLDSIYASEQSALFHNYFSSY